MIKKINYNLLRSGNKITFEYDNSELDMQINIPLLYYKGYTAQIVDKDGKVTKLDISKNEENGFVLVSGDKSLSGTITVKYSLTTVQIVCYIISGVSLIGIIVYIFSKKINLKDKLKNKNKS